MLIDPVIETDPEVPTLSEIGLPLVRPLPVRAADFGPEDLDLCLVTHAHGDHLAPRTIPTLLHSTECRFVVPLSCRERMLELGVPEERMIAARHGRLHRIWRSRLCARPRTQYAFACSVSRGPSSLLAAGLFGAANDRFIWSLPHLGLMIDGVEGPQREGENPVGGDGATKAAW